MKRLFFLLLMLSSASALRVLVTGAGGRTGKLVVEQLCLEKNVEVVALARSKKAQKALKKQVPSLKEFKAVDVMDKAALEEVMVGCDAVVLCTSAVPKIKIWSLLKVLVKKSILRSKDPGRPEFSFPEGGTPEEVDWLGAQKQMDAASKCGVKHFVMVSSMGATQPENFLNTIGRRPDGSGGDILLWKRKAERYLMGLGMDYTIVHPGGLVDEKPKKRELLIDVNDKLLELKTRSIPRSDVARVCCAALFDDRAKNKSFDIASKPPDDDDAKITEDIPKDLFTQLADKDTDYTTKVIPDPPSIFR